jgi:hypothetical protein
MLPIFHGFDRLALGGEYWQYSMVCALALASGNYGKFTPVVKDGKSFAAKIFSIIFKEESN